MPEKPLDAIEKASLMSSSSSSSSSSDDEKEVPKLVSSEKKVSSILEEDRSSDEEANEIEYLYEQDFYKVTNAFPPRGIGGPIREQSILSFRS